jgi:hypothetical protein
MLRPIEPEADLNLWTQWSNDIDHLGAMSLDPPVPSSKAGAKKVLESLASRPGPQSFLVICEKPTHEESPALLDQHDDYFVKDGKARYPCVGLLNIGNPDGINPSTRIAHFGVALDRKHQSAHGFGFSPRRPSP